MVDATDKLTHQLPLYCGVFISEKAEEFVLSPSDIGI